MLFFYVFLFLIFYMYLSIMVFARAVLNLKVNFYLEKKQISLTHAEYPMILIILLQ